MNHIGVVTRACGVGGVDLSKCSDFMIFSKHPGVIIIWRSCFCGFFARLSQPCRLVALLPQTPSFWTSILCGKTPWWQTESLYFLAKLLR